MKAKRAMAAILAAAVFITSYGFSGVSAATGIPTQPAPSKLAISPLNPNTEPAIGYSSSDGGASGFYTDIGWERVDNPQGITVTGKYVNIYLEESAKGYRTQRGAVLKEKDLPAATSPVRMRNLNSGTVYKANAKAYYEYADLNNVIKKSDESSSSNTVKFLTDIKLQSLTVSTNKIKIIWDDVWNEGKRINYKLYVSENKEFTNTLPIYISEEQIGAVNAPVIVDQANGSLIYEHTVKDPGRVYYVKVVPDISDPEIQRNESSNIVLTSTYILAKTTKMSTTDAGTIWRLDWSPVVAGISNSDIKVQYQIDKYVGNVPIPMLIEDSTTTFITVPVDEQVSYYIIRAIVTKGGLPYYPDSVKIVSDKIILKEGEVPASPPMPEIVEFFKDSSDAYIISYSDILKLDQTIEFKGQLGTDTATILWRVPKKADGSVDTEVMYDIWLIEDPDKIDTPPDETKIAEDFVPAEANFIRDVADDNRTIGYKYKLTGLKQNHTYYYKIVAKKNFAEEVDGVIQNVEYNSYPALKVVITLPGGAIDRPLLPSNPPLEIRSENNKKLITDDSVTIQLKNRWYEMFNKPPYANTGKWYYVKTDKLSLNDTVEYNPVTTPPDGKTYRKVSYDKGVTLYVGVEEYFEGIDINQIDNYKLEKVPVTPNDPTEDPTLNAPESVTNNTPNYAKHNVVIPVEQLKPNTTYILWVRAVRDIGNGEEPIFSEVSNPIIFTTSPAPTQVVEKPIVPAFNYSFTGDTYVDLGWNYKEGNTYHIKYGTVDDVTKATGNVTVTSEQIKQSGVNYVRIPGLTANTLYYFWIQAEAFSEDRTLSEKSEWGDSLPLRTLKDVPPSTPRGFGVKNTLDAITKNTITFEWIQEPGLEYIIEVAGGVDYKELKQYKAGAVTEFKVDGLKSNFRYFARLYAYDPLKKLTSIPTQSISVRTLRSSDDYDSDQDVDNVISGEYIEKAPTVVGGVWVVKVTGVNADRLVEVIKTDRILDYTIDVSKPPSTASSISLHISRKVFDRLEQLKENLEVKTAVVSYNFRAGVLSGVKNENTQKEQIYVINLTLVPQTPNSRSNELLIRQPLAQIGITLDNGVSNIAIDKLWTPLIIKYPYSNRSDYTEGKTLGYMYNASRSLWEKQNSSNKYDPDNNMGILSIQTATPGLFAMADRTSGIYDDIYDYEYESSIVNVAFAHTLKSVNGRLFRPEDKATVGEGIKLIFDTIDNYSYDNGYLEAAVKAGFIKSGKTAGSTLTRQDAARMAVVLYEIKSGTKVRGSNSAVSGYSDYSKIDKDNIDKVAFAVENGFVPNISATTLDPAGAVTRGELMYMIEKALVLVGEIE